MAQQHINRSAPNDGLGDTLYNQAGKIEDNFTELYANKVDKITGKGLSDTNFTQVEKDKLAGLTTGGQVQSDWNQGDAGEIDFIKNKPVNTSDFNNDGDGTQAFVTDTPSAAPSARINGSWVAISDASAPVILDGIAGVTAGFTVGQTVYVLPAGAKCIDVYLSHTKQYKITPNNGTIVNRWSQTGVNFKLTKASALNNYIYIEYIL